MDIQKAAKQIRANPVWRQFKEKWDNRIPRKNSKLFAEYETDAEEVRISNQQIVERVATLIAGS